MKTSRTPIAPQIRQHILSDASVSLNVVDFPWIEVNPKQTNDLVEVLAHYVQPVSLRWPTGQSAILFCESPTDDQAATDNEIVTAYLRSTISGEVFVGWAGS